MREFVFNEASLVTRYATDTDAILALDGIARGVASLVRAGVAVSSLRLIRPLHEIAVSPTLDLWRLVQAALKDPRTKTSAIFFLSITQRIPIDDGLEQTMLDRLALADLEMPVTSGATALILCALSGRIALGFPKEPRWDIDLLALTVVMLDNEGNEISKQHEVDNLAREAHATPIADRHRAREILNQTRESFWVDRATLCPNLYFGLDVNSHLSCLGEQVFRQVLQMLVELDRVAANWRDMASARPPYLSKVTPESEATMQQYGQRRIFRDAKGGQAKFELHARLQNGFRLHFRELASERRIEIGYVGRHLPTKKHC